MIYPVWLIYAVFQSILVTVLTVVCLVYIILYYNKSRNIECCKERHNIIIDIIVVFVPIIRVINSFIVATDNNNVITENIFDSITACIITIFMVKFAEYSFNIWYEIKLSKSIHQQKWKSIIDNTHTNNWYTLNRKKWGNKLFTNKVTKIYIAFQSGIPLCITVVKLFFHENSNEYKALNAMTLIIVLPFVIPLGIIIKCYYDVNSFDDVFLITAQYKRNGYIVTIAFILWFGLSMVNTAQHIIIIDIIIDMMLWIPYPVVVLNDTYFVIKHVINKQSSNETTITNSITVRTVLSNDEAIDIFMRHLFEGKYMCLY